MRVCGGGGAGDCAVLFVDRGGVVEEYELCAGGGVGLHFGGDTDTVTLTERDR